MSPGTKKAILISLSIIVVVWGINGVYLSKLAEYSVSGFWAADVAQWIGLPVVIVSILASKHGVLPIQYGFGLSSLNFRALVWGGIAAMTFYPAFFWVRDISWSLLGNPKGFFVLTGVFPEGTLGTVVWLYSAFSAGIVESLFFIGLPWLLWSQYSSDRVVRFTLLCSIIFAAVHWEQGPHVVVGALAFNLVACAWFFRLRALWSIAIGHIIVDLIAFN